MSWLIQQLGYLNEPLKGVRGVISRPGITAAKPQILQVAELLFNFEGEKLKPGEDVPVVVPVPDLPLNADIKKLVATIEIQKDETAKKASFKQESVIEEEGGTKKTFKVDIAMLDLPRNIAARLDGGEVFWSFAGTAVQGEYELPDFVEHANAYLDKLPVETKEVLLKFLVKADGPGKVKITIKDVEYSVIQTQSWSNPLDNTIRLDRTFELDFGGIERVILDAFANKTNHSVSLSAVRADLGGEFGPERLFGSFEAHQGREFATISSDYALAQSIKFEKALSAKPIRCIGVTGAFQADSEAELYLEIQNDAGGFPSFGPPLAKSNLTIAPAEAKENKQWILANLEAPVDLSSEILHWVVLKGIRGKVLLGLQDQAEKYLQQPLVNRGGQLWKSLGRRSASVTVALLRLVYLPELDNQTAAIEIGIEGAPALQRFDPRPEAQTLSLDVPQGRQTDPAVIIIKSHARGTLSIANVIQEYAQSGAKTLLKWQSAKARQMLKK